jgi:hypothetical protein
MTARPRRTTTLVGPNRLVLAAATGGLVALASVGTAVLVLTGTSAVTPVATAVPPLPHAEPLAKAPGVVVLPASPVARGAGARPGTSRSRIFLPTPAATPPLALSFVDQPPAPALEPGVPAAVQPPFDVEPVVPPVAVVLDRKALRALAKEARAQAREARKAAKRSAHAALSVTRHATRTDGAAEHRVGPAVKHAKHPRHPLKGKHAGWHGHR